MPDIVDYYEQLNISEKLKLDEINAKLVELKRVWIQRELNQPEKARKFLMLIDEACEVFKTEETKAQYNRALENSKKQEPDTSDSVDMQRREMAKKWEQQGVDHLTNHRYDLAAEAFDQALLYCRQEDDNYCSICRMSSTAYSCIKNYNKAIACINNAIIAEPENVDHYRRKGDIYHLIKTDITINLENGQYVDMNLLNSTVQKEREVLNYILERSTGYKNLFKNINQRRHKMREKSIPKGRKVIK